MVWPPSSSRLREQKDRKRHWAGWMKTECSRQEMLPTFMDVMAAQVTDGPVDSIMTNPGSDAFTMNLIKLDAQSMVDVFGGKKEADDSYTPPVKFVANGVLTISMHSGHSFRIFNARLSRNGFQNGINMQNVLAMGIRVDMLKPTDGKERRYRTYPPGVT